MRVSTGMILGSAGALCALGGALPAQAQAIDDKAWIQAAAYWADVDSSFRLDSIGRANLGTDIDFETDLALDDSEVLPSFSAGWRVMDRLIIGGDYYGLDRSGTRILDRDIIFDDVTFPASASVSSAMDTQIYRLTLGYSFIKNDTFEAGAALGLHATDFETSLEGQASIGGATATTTRRGRDFLAPLPTVGAYGNWKVADRITINGRIDYMSLEVGDYDGGVTNAQVSASYRFTPNFGVGIMYRLVDYGVDITKDDWTGELNYEFNGPALYLEAAF